MIPFKKLAEIVHRRAKVHMNWCERDWVSHFIKHSNQGTFSTGYAEDDDGLKFCVLCARRVHDTAQGEDDNYVTEDGPIAWIDTLVSNDIRLTLLCGAYLAQKWGMPEKIAFKRSKNGEQGKVHVYGTKLLDRFVRKYMKDI
jgi:hypothetical protein